MFYITNIILKNIRGLGQESRELKLNLLEDREVPRKRTLLVGTNGTCKTTILRCIAIGLCDPADGNSLVAEPFGRIIAQDKDEANIIIGLIDDKGINGPFSITTTLKWDKVKEAVIRQDSSNYLLSSEKLFLCGYGVGRANQAGQDFYRRYRIIDSAYSLFQYEQGMINTELLLRRLRDYVGENVYKVTMGKIKKALGLTDEDQIDLPKGGGVEISGPSIGKEIPLEGWADGYRLTLSWLMDFYGWAMRAQNVSPSGEVSGILLVDELEQHLHPSLQTDLLPRLSNLFPKLQIFATTHSPLVALGAAPKELVVLKRKENYIYSEEVPDFSGYSAEDMLRDENIFNSQVYSPEMNEKLELYKKLVSKTKAERTLIEQNELATLAREIGDKLPFDEESPLIAELKKLRNQLGL